MNEENNWYPLTNNVMDAPTGMLLQELRYRGYQLLKNDYQEVVARIVQLHRTGDHRWQSEALEYLYNLDNKVV